MNLNLLPRLVRDFYYAKKNDPVNHFLKAVKPPAMRVRTEKFITMYDNKKTPCYNNCVGQTQIIITMEDQ